MITKKIVRWIVLSLLIIFLVIWLFSLAKCEVLTILHGKEFNEIYKENTMIGEIDYLKILDYHDNFVGFFYKYQNIYYVSKERSNANILIFIKESDVWKYHAWETTVWSSSGSASDVIWPYWWHFIYGGF